jgi:hypothetical protein
MIHLLPIVEITESGKRKSHAKNNYLINYSDLTDFGMVRAERGVKNADQYPGEENS